MTVKHGKSTILIMIILITVIIVVGCSKEETNETKNILYELEMETEIDIEGYEQVISEILTYREFDDHAKAMIRDKYENVVSNNVFRQLETLTNNAKVVYPGEQEGITDLKSEGEYPIYDSNFNIAGYGEYDEYIHSIREFNTFDLNSIENTEASSNKIIVQVNNKFNDVFYLHATVENGVITYINILR